MDVCGTNSAGFPANSTAGLTFAACVHLAANPGPAWSVTAVLRGAGSIDIVATSDGASHSFNVDAATTAAWTPGDYWGALRAMNGATVLEVGRFNFTVLPDIAAAGAGYDGRTQNDIALSAIEAVIAQRATIDQSRYKINNRELWRTSISDLMKLKSFYAAAVRRERRKASGCGNFGRVIPVKF